MKLPELKELAKQMNLRGTSTMRRPALIETIIAARTGGEAPAGVTVGPARKARVAKEEAPAVVTTPPTATPVVVEPAAAPVHIELPPRIKPPTSSVASAPATSSRAAERDMISLPRLQRRNRDINQAAGISSAAKVAKLNDILAALPDRSERGREEQIAQSARMRTDRALIQQAAEARASRVESVEHEVEAIRNRRLRMKAAEAGERSSQMVKSDRENENRFEEIEQSLDNLSGVVSSGMSANDGESSLVPVAGIVDILESYAFIRTSGYLPGPNDVYVAMSIVRKYGLRSGDAVQGTIKTPHEGDRRNQRQKYVPIQTIESINGMTVEEARNRPDFNKLTPLYPTDRLRMETGQTEIIGRMIDIVSPIGKGQRGLIVSPPKAGKTITLQHIANSITANNPEVHLMVVLVDERPEEVTDMERTVQGEVISSTFDRPATDHTVVAELAIERAKRLVELGQDVVVLLDSMTRLARAYNIAAPASGRILSGGVDAQALYPPKKFFGAARNIENGGSLTIISSALVETGSKMDEVIFEEFKGTGNMELRLSSELANKRLFPAIDINASGTRREELITPPEELAVIFRLRRLLGGLEPEQAYSTLVPRLKKTGSNVAFLSSIAASVPNNNN
jgi:transcription termination factor Rho